MDAKSRMEISFLYKKNKKKKQEDKTLLAAFIRYEKLTK